MKGKNVNNQEYRVVIRSGDIYKEFTVSEDRPVVRIGTTQDCDERLKKELFAVPVCIDLTYSESGWILSSEDLGEAVLLFKSQHAGGNGTASAKPGDVLEVVTDKSPEAVLFTIEFSYAYQEEGRAYDTIIDIRGQSTVTIGAATDANIKLSGPYIGHETVRLHCNAGNCYLGVESAPMSATVNGARILGNMPIQECDFFGIADYEFYYRNGILYTAMRPDITVIGMATSPIRDENPAFTYPKLNRSPRMLYERDTRPIEIKDPPTKPEKLKQNIVASLLPALIMLGVVLITRSGLIGGGSGGGNISMLIFSVVSMGMGIVTSIMSFKSSSKRSKEKIVAWNEDYDRYIASKRSEIEAEQEKERRAAIDTYPSDEELRTFVKVFSGRIFERNVQDADFLDLRLGLGKMPAGRTVTCQQRDDIQPGNEKSDIPQRLATEYADIDNMPVLLHVKSAGNVGIVGDSACRYDIFKSLLLNICVLHSYEDVQIIVMVPPDRVGLFDWVKWLPHINTSGGGLRGIVYDEESRNAIFEYLYALMAGRDSASGSDKAQMSPYYVVFALDDYAIKTHPLTKYADKCNKLGVSFVYFSEYKDNLPKECKEIVEVTAEGGTLKKSDDNAFARTFVREHVADESIGFAAGRLAPVYCDQIALASRLTSHITLFELLNIFSPDDLDLKKRWAASNVQKSMAAPLGVDVSGNMIYLDLHEKAHGPHGLVAGTTGSGKSEIMQSYILSAAVNFHPYEVAFVIIDFKGGGMANQFEHLPHLIGKITDIDSHEINRSLMSIRAELEKRKRLFAEYGVNHIDQYIGKFKSGEAQVALPHLILIVDEFAELKAEQPEFMKELISTARVGRSLGIHLILATQKPAGQVNDQIWSNSRFKLCLKVATVEDSREVLKSPLAAEIREPGRAYLQVGNNEIFTLFQSAYSGAPAQSDANGNAREFSLSEVAFSGKRTKVYERKAKRSGDNKETQLKAMVEYIDRYCKQNGVTRLPNICLPPLPEIVDIDDMSDEGAGFGVNIGVYDDPNNQVQPTARLPLSDGNVMIIGAAQMGKTNLLQVIIRQLATDYSPAAVNIYILDFASRVLKVYERMAHVGGVLTDADDEGLGHFFKMMRQTVEERKIRFASLGVGSYEAYAQSGNTDLPRVVIMIDNLLTFKETYEGFEESLLVICREGQAVGVTVIATSKQTSGISYKYLGNFPTRIALTCTESGEYSGLFERCRMSPKEVPGRGLLCIDKVVYEFQTALAYDGIADVRDGETVRTETMRIEELSAFIDAVNAHSSVRAKAVPSIPAILEGSYWESGQLTFRDYEVPIALTYDEIEPVALDLAHTGSLGIYGREGFGKSNLLALIMDYLKSKIFELSVQMQIVDGFDRQLAQYQNLGFIDRYTIDVTEVGDVIDDAMKIAEERMNMLKDGTGLDNVPVWLCVLANPQVYEASRVTKDASDKLKKLLSDARQLRMCFIFAGIPNNGEFSVPDMMKLARGLERYVLLDDLANVHCLGNTAISATDLRTYKKKLAIGDGYTYSERDGITKVKIVRA